jgi:glycosyltransferase involved in cell wall biosynthesis
MAVSPPPLVSVIIPVFNDAARLRDCLAALERQSWPRERLQVIVVDNGSTDDLGTVLEAFPSVVRDLEGRPGSYAARNRGLELARGEILALTDSDCLPEPGWIAAGVAELQAHPEVGIVGGNVELRAADPARPTAVELHELLWGFPQEAYVTADRYSVTANLFTWRTVMDRVGPFDAALKSGGDRDWGTRAAKAGIGIRYAPDAVVGHPARRTHAELGHKLRRVAGGRAQRIRRQPGPARWRLLRDVVVSLRPPVTAIPRVLRDPRVSPRAAPGVIAVAFFVRYRTAWERLRLLLGAAPSR